MTNRAGVCLDVEALAERLSMDVRFHALRTLETHVGRTYRIAVPQAGYGGFLAGIYRMIRNRTSVRSSSIQVVAYEDSVPCAQPLDLIRLQWGGPTDLVVRRAFELVPDLEAGSYDAIVLYAPVEQRSAERVEAAARRLSPGGILLAVIQYPFDRTPRWSRYTAEARRAHRTVTGRSFDARYQPLVDTRDKQTHWLLTVTRSTAKEKADGAT
jgi:hypothetical protein